VRAEAIRLGGKPVVYALSDATYLSLYAVRESLKDDMTLVFPDSKSVEIAFDKAATYSIARVSNVPTITTHMPVTTEEVERLGMTLSYPSVIKPRKSVSWQEGKGVFGSAEYVHTKEELMSAYTRLCEVCGEPPLVQERITGEEYGVEMIAHEGKPLALVAHRRIRSLSPTGGASVLKEVAPHGALFDMLTTYARKLTLELKWEGPIMVEFKVDSDTRTPKLMEINGRFWGSLPLSVAAGVDMPFLYYLLATGGDYHNMQAEPKEGVLTRHFLGDVRHLLHVLIPGGRMRKYGYPSRREALRAFLSLPRGTTSDVWSWSDPIPAFYEVIDAIKKLWK
jgi:predicted ATP-grasp superfamily ATP-dependent carboligase